MSEPIREQLAKVILGYRPEELGGAQPRDWSAWESSLLVSDRILRSFVLSPVGETEAAKLPLDPELPTLTRAHCKFCETDLGDYR